MNKLAVGAIATVLVGAGLAVGIDKTYNPKPTNTDVIVATKTITKTVQPKVYGVGDTQDGITLEAVYAPATPTDAKFAAGTAQMLVSVKTSSPVQDSSVIYTSDGQYLKPITVQTAECQGSCTTFVAPNNVYIDSFIYKGLIWQL